MDILFKNPTYFFETYFDYSLVDFLVVFICCCIIISILCLKRFHSKIGRIFFVIVSSLYLATLIGVTILNANRVEMQSLNLSPITNIKELFGVMSIHQWRGCLSNVLFFIPFGVLGAIYFRKRRIVFTVLSGLVVSIVLEVLQYLLHRGCAETMDVICNFLGTFIGAVFTVGIIGLINKMKTQQ